jgi:hypothetical protein
VLEELLELSDEPLVELLDPGELDAPEEPDCSDEVWAGEATATHTAQTANARSNCLFINKIP